MNKSLEKILRTLLKRTKQIYSTTIDTEMTKEYLVDLIEGLLEEDLSYLIKDNSVPSLDNLRLDENDFEDILINLEEVKNYSYKDACKDIIRAIKLNFSIDIKLQNGAETSKEQLLFTDEEYKIIKNSIPKGKHRASILYKTNCAK